MTPPPRAHSVPRRAAVVHLARLALHALVATAAAGAHATADAPAEHAPGIGAMVWGIVSYTRWPQPPQPLRVCIAGTTAHEDDIRGASTWTPPERNCVIHTLAEAEDPAAACDLVYVGALAPAATAALIGQLAGKAVLSIGEGSDFCSAGGMFCIETGAHRGGDAGPRFGANLDAISRSGLRVSPQVLRLSRQLRRPTP